MDKCEFTNCNRKADVYIQDLHFVSAKRKLCYEHVIKMGNSLKLFFERKPDVKHAFPMSQFHKA